MNDVLKPLLTRLVDYAGLFPPAGLSMNDAVANYARYRASDHAWMLARFILPVARLDEFEAAKKNHTEPGDVWLLSVLPSSDLTANFAAIDDFNTRNEGRALIDTLEAKADSREMIRSLSSAVPDNISLFMEIPVDDEPEPLVAAIAASGRFAKIRTGGVTPDAFPPAEQIVRFIRRCHEHDVPFKATAGLHHPLRCVKPLTYEEGAPTGTMNGFVNVFLAAALLRAGLEDDVAIEILGATDTPDFEIGGDLIRWRTHEIASSALEIARDRFSISFGSCSFDEPVDDLRSLGWLDQENQLNEQ